MRLLVDTNIFLEVILAQERSQEAQSLLSRVQEHEFFISDYSLHSIGILLLRSRSQNTQRSNNSNIGCVSASLATNEPKRYCVGTGKDCCSTSGDGGTARALLLPAILAEGEILYEV